MIISRHDSFLLYSVSAAWQWSCSAVLLLLIGRISGDGIDQLGRPQRPARRLFGRTG
jgi:hypothetical protein